MFSADGLPKKIFKKNIKCIQNCKKYHPINQTKYHFLILTGLTFLFLHDNYTMFTRKKDEDDMQ